MSVFRIEKNKNYTVMSNHHLRNKELSLKAKGLLSQMLSLPENWDYTLAGLSHINKESIDAIRTVTLPDGTVIDYADRTTVTVSDKDNKPVSDMPVNVKDNKGGDKTATTDEDGKAIVPPLSENYTDADGKAVVDGYTVIVEDTKATSSSKKRSEKCYCTSRIMNIYSVLKRTKMTKLTAIVILKNSTVRGVAQR